MLTKPSWGLRSRTENTYSNPSNTYQFAKNCNIEDLKKFVEEELKDIVRYCRIRQKEIRKQSNVLRKVHLRDYLIDARVENQVVRAHGIKQEIDREHNVRMWYLIQRTVTDPSSPVALKIHTVK